VDDDVLPLDSPVIDRYGNTIKEIFIAKGTTVRISLSSVNRLEAFWGKDSKEFNPDRWLGDNLSDKRAVEIGGYRHLLTFLDGPRACLGRAFAVTEFKVCQGNFCLELQLMLLRLPYRY
jgi:cytochrome P450